MSPHALFAEIARKMLQRGLAREPALVRARYLAALSCVIREHGAEVQSLVRPIPETAETGGPVRPASD